MQVTHCASLRLEGWWSAIAAGVTSPRTPMRTWGTRRFSIPHASFARMGHPLRVDLALLGAEGFLEFVRGNAGHSLCFVAAGRLVVSYRCRRYQPTYADAYMGHPAFLYPPRELRSNGAPAARGPRVARCGRIP